MNTLYQLIKHPESVIVLKTAEEEGWKNECYKIGKSVFVPMYRLDLLTKVTRETIQSHLLSYQLHLVKKTQLDIMSDDKWRFNWTITWEQYNQFRGYAIPLLKKIFRYNKTKAENTFDWFYQNFGLRIKE